MRRHVTPGLIVLIVAALIVAAALIGGCVPEDAGSDELCQDQDELTARPSDGSRGQPTVFIARLDGNCASRCYYRAGQLIWAAPDPLTDADSITEALLAVLDEGGVSIDPADVSLRDSVVIEDEGNQTNALHLFDIASDQDPLDIAATVEAPVAPNYLTALAPSKWIFGPGRRPTPANGPSAQVPNPAHFTATSSAAGTGPKIGVMDTGFDVAALQHLSHLPGPPSTSSVTQHGAPGEFGTGFVEGHGTFIATMLLQLVPSAELHVTDAPFTSTVTDAVGASSVSDDFLVAQKLIDTFGSQSGQPVEVAALNLSLGSYGCSDVYYEGGPEEAEAPATYRQPLATRAALLGLKAQHDASGSDDPFFVVAAAGNDGTQHRFYPAAFAADPAFGGDCAGTFSDWLISVGSDPAIEGTKRFDYSNHGCWVRTYARGSNVVSAVAGGWQSWSGTSFAAPCVAAYLASGGGVAGLPTAANTPLECGLVDVRERPALVVTPRTSSSPSHEGRPPDLS